MAKLLSSEQIAGIHYSCGFTHKHDQISQMMAAFVEYAINADQSELYDIVQCYYKNGCIAKMNASKGTVSYTKLPHNFLKEKNPREEYRVENAIHVLLTVLLKDYGYNVGLTTAKYDRGADVIISKKDSDLPELLIDVKAGESFTDKHVIWHFKNSPWLLRAVRDPRNIHTNQTQKKLNRSCVVHVGEVTFKNLFCNLTSILTKGMSNAEIESYAISLHKEFSQFGK